jgi:UDP-2,4-diacetamido-2,4,6-trideoxy-beta-L-altropyranose hydrolase
MPSAIGRLISDSGHGVALLSDSRSRGGGTASEHSDWLGIPQDVDAGDTIRALADDTWDWLIVDHYALDARWERPLRRVVRRLMVVDDIANRRHDCNLLVDQNLFSTMGGRYSKKVPPDCTMLLGPRYALLRREFTEAHRRVGPRDGSVRTLLIQMGGVDAGNQTQKVLDALQRLPRGRYEVDVVIGAQHPARSEIRAACRRRCYRCHVQTRHVATLMSNADLAVGACGSTSWERCCLGLPTVSLTHAKNESDIARGLQAAGAIIYAGHASRVTERRLAATIAAAIDDAAGLRRISRVAYRLVDGKGTERVYRAMSSLA